MPLSKRDFFQRQDEIFASIEDSHVTAPEDTGLATKRQRVSEHSVKHGRSSWAEQIAGQHDQRRDIANKQNPDLPQSSSLATQVSPIQDTPEGVFQTGRLASSIEQRNTSARERKMDHYEHATIAAKPTSPKHLTETSSQVLEEVIAPRPDRLFDGLLFYFVPNSSTNLARKMRMNKVRENGGTILNHFDLKQVTHIIVDKNINAGILLRTISVPELPASIKVYNELWTPDCVIYGKLVDDISKYHVMGIDYSERTEGEVGHDLAHTSTDIHAKDLTNSVNTHRSASPETGPPLFPETQEAHSAQAQPSTVSPTIAFAVSNSDVSDRVLDTQDELSTAIHTIRSLGEAQLPEEAEDNKHESGKFDQMPEEGIETKKNWQEKFRCMVPHVRVNTGQEGPNDFVIKKLQVMQDYYETSKHPDDKWKPRGYRLAIASLRTCSEPVISYESAIALPNIGDRLAKHIEEIARTGTMYRADNLGEDYVILQKFIGIYGVGPTKANEWLRQGIRTMQDILDRGNPTVNQRIGIALYDDLNTRIPRDEVHAHKVIVQQEAAKIDQHLQLYVMGSYRRGAQDCGDIDILITRKDTSRSSLVQLWQRLLAVLTDKVKFLTHALIVSSTRDGLKWQGISKLNRPGSLYRRIDFLLTPWEQRGPALLYFTGNDLFNRSMRLLASRKGYNLNQKALMKGVLRGRNGEVVSEGINTQAQTEEDIFRILGIPFRRPEERCIS